MRPIIYIATSNEGKIRDFEAAASSSGVQICKIPNFLALVPVVENGLSFEANAQKKAQTYSHAVAGELVLADDSGLEVDALDGEPGVHSARYAADVPGEAGSNTDDDANNLKLLRALQNVPANERTGRFICVLAAARDEQILATFHGVADGMILDRPQGANGFGYDPLFYFPQIQKTFAELSAEEKAGYSHRGKAFRQFLNWYARSPSGR